MAPDCFINTLHEKDIPVNLLFITIAIIVNIAKKSNLDNDNNMLYHIHSYTKYIG